MQVCACVHASSRTELSCDGRHRAGCMYTCINSLTHSTCDGRHRAGCMYTCINSLTHSTCDGRHRAVGRLRWSVLSVESANCGGLRPIAADCGGVFYQSSQPMSCMQCCESGGAFHFSQPMICQACSVVRAVAPSIHYPFSQRGAMPTGAGFGAKKSRLDVALLCFALRGLGLIWT